MFTMAADGLGVGDLGEEKLGVVSTSRPWLELGQERQPHQQRMPGLAGMGYTGQSPARSAG